MGDSAWKLRPNGEFVVLFAGLVLGCMYQRHDLKWVWYVGDNIPVRADTFDEAKAAAEAAIRAHARRLLELVGEEP